MTMTGNRLLCMLVVLAVLVSCGSPPDVSEGTVVDKNISVRIDDDLGVACFYMIIDTYYGEGVGLSCLPLSDLKLDDGHK